MQTPLLLDALEKLQPLGLNLKALTLSTVYGFADRHGHLQAP